VRAYGREAELAAIGASIDATVDGRGGVIVIAGPPGIGKTWVLDEARRLATDAGVRPLAATAHESQYTVPFGPLLDAAMHGATPLGDPNALRRLASRSDLHSWIAYDLQAVLEEAAAETPLMVCLDDLQWADAGTLVALRSLTSHLADVGVVWLLAHRTGELRRPLRDLLRHVGAGGATQLALDPLVPDAVSAIVTDVVGAPPGPTLAPLVREAEGNPFLLYEVLHGLAEEDRLGVVDGLATVHGQGLPRRLSTSMQDRLVALGDDVRRLVRFAAVMPRRFDARQLAALLDRSPLDIVDAVDAAIAAELLTDDGGLLGFRHDLVREAVRASIAPALRGPLEREAARVLLAGGAAPAEVATLLMSSAEQGDREAVDVLREAAQTLATSDAEVAAQLSRRALDLLADHDPSRGVVVGETVILLNMAGRWAEAQELGGEALTAALDTHQESAVRLSLSRMITRSASDRALENVRALSLPGLTGAERAAHVAWRSYNEALRGDAQDARATASEALTTPAVTAAPELHALCLATLSMVDCADGAGARGAARLREMLARRAAAGGSPLGVLELQHSLLLAVLGDLTESRRVAAATIARAQRERNGAVLAILTLNTALVNVAAGRLADARTEADSIEALLGDIGSGHMGGWLRMLVVSQLAQHTGERRLEDAAVDAADRLRHDENPSVHRWAVRVRAIDAMGRGDAAAAARWLGDEPFTALTPALPNELDFLVVAAHIAVDAADDTLAGRVRRAADRLAAEQPGNELFHAVADHLHGVLDADAARLVSAADQLAGSERPLLLAAAREDAGRQLLAVDRRAEAVDLLAAAAEGYDACDAKASAERVGRLLGRERERRGRTRRRATYGWTSLTESELAVVRIVARGATNRDAAAQLCLSPHTVSSHLRHAFQKLGINSRVQLANVVHDADR